MSREITGERIGTNARGIFLANGSDCVFVTPLSVNTTQSGVPNDHQGILLFDDEPPTGKQPVADCSPGSTKYDVMRLPSAETAIDK
jgi:hypothetical protein